MIQDQPGSCAEPRANLPLAPADDDRAVADLSRERIKRRPVLGGLLNEYERAA
jgi:hypothetical protein